MSDLEQDDGKKITQLPLARVKRLMKSVPVPQQAQAMNLSNDSVVLMTRAAELFVESFIDAASKRLKPEKGTIMKYDTLGMPLCSFLVSNVDSIRCT